VVRPIHDRMPVILMPEDRATWLDRSATPRALRSLLRPYAGDLEVRAVSRRVNSHVHDDPSCIEPMDLPL
jgi:putative SOS response-associated peptidase YedK